MTYVIGRRPTTRDGALLVFAEFSDTHAGIPPTVREFADLLGLASKNGGHYWFHVIEQAGMIRHAVPSRDHGNKVAADWVLTPADRARVEEVTA